MGVIVTGTAEGTRVIVLRVAHHGSVWVQARPHNQPERFLLLVTLLLLPRLEKMRGKKMEIDAVIFPLAPVSLPSGLNIVNFSPEKTPSQMDAAPWCYN